MAPFPALNAFESSILLAAKGNGGAVTPKGTGPAVWGVKTL
jgi:hypothetical protein